mgnify:CR=1 FL=1
MFKSTNEKKPLGADATDKTTAMPKVSAKPAKPAKAKKARRHSKKKGPATPEDRRRQLSWLCGGCAAVAVISLGFSGATYLSAQNELAKLNSEMVEVVVPKDDIAAGTAITSDMLETEKVPSRYVPKDAAKKKGVKDVVGKTPTASLTKGVPISVGTLQGGSNATSITLAVSEGHVAKTFGLDAAASMSPLLKPGDYVTVIASFGSGNTVETQNLEHIKVLATDATLNGSTAGNSYSTVTLELDEQQLDTLMTASGISLSAEPYTDNKSDGDNGSEQQVELTTGQQPADSADSAEEE